MTVTTIRGKPLKFYPASPSKSDCARELLRLGYTVSEISKAVPMAYSQVHSIAKASHPTEAAMQAGLPGQVRGLTPPKVAKAERTAALKVVERERANEQAGRPVGTGLKPNPRVGKLRIGSLPSDMAMGECANCGYDLVVRKSPHGFMFVHVNATSEEYLATIQFCQAVPKSLIEGAHPRGR